MKRVLVTGASGFIGRHCLPILLEKGYEVHAVSTKTLDQKDVMWHQADLLNTDRVKSLMADVRPSHLLHFAWCTTPGKYWTSNENLSWLKAGVDLLQEFGRMNGVRVVMAGTCAEYDWRYGFCSEQITPLTPTTLYGVSKNALNKVLESYSALQAFSAAWGRIFLLYGPGEHPSRLAASVINSILDGAPAKSTHGEQVRDFLYVEDAASAFVDLLDCQVSGPVNIASGEPVRIKEVVSEIAEAIGRPDLVNLGSVPPPPNDPPLLFADVTRLNREVKWMPHTALNAGIRKTIDWWKNRKGLIS